MLTLPEKETRAEIETAMAGSSVTTNEIVTRAGPIRWRPLMLVGLAAVVAVGFTVPGLIPGFGVGRSHDDHHHDHAVVDSTDSYPAGVGGTAEPPLPVAIPVVDFDPLTAVANYDASVIASLDGNELVFSAGATREVLAKTLVDDGFELRSLSAAGTKAALARPITDGSGRTGTELLIADWALGRNATFQLDGRVEPEAFATDGRSLFVIDHQVAGEPGSYRVRPFNLDTGELEVIVGPTKVPLTENMNGRGRRQTWGLDDGRLYTLYIRQTNHVHASGLPGSDGFVHILDLDEEWAVCLDLPPAFGKGDLATTALSVNRDTLAVLDLNAGRLAYASVADRNVSHVVELPTRFRETVAAMTAAATRTKSGGDQPVIHLALTSTAVAVGVGQSVAWFDSETLGPLGEPVELPFSLLGFTSLPRSLVAWPAAADHAPIELGRPRQG